MARVDHLSCSAIMTFLRNQVQFQKEYIALFKDSSKSPSLVVGKAFHKALEEFYRGKSIQDSISVGLESINDVSDYEINFGKKGSREKMIKEYTTLVNKYFEECPKYDVVEVERRLEGYISGVPMVGVVDLIVAGITNGSIRLRDYKTVTSYSDENETNYKYLIQGYIYLVLAEKVFGKKVESVTFDEIKKTINKDGSPQRREVTFDRESLLEFAPVAQKLITNIFAYANDPRSKFFPNPSDIFDGQSSMDVVSNIEEGFDAAKIRHKTVVADRFAPRNVTIDVDQTSGTNEELIVRKFTEFGIGGIIGQTYTGSSVIRYTFKPNRGIAMNNIARRSDDLAIALKSKYVRIQAPIAGTDLVGVEIPNEDRRIINFEDKHLNPGTTMIPIGEDVLGEIHYCDLAKMPHLLIAGQTGAGKSVMVNVILQALTKQLPVSKLQLVLVDPKQVELAMYEDDEHLMQPIVTDALGAAHALDDLVKLMEKRYKTLRKAGVRSIDDYKGKMPRIVVVVDEFADLIMSDIAPSVESMDIKQFNENLQWILSESPTGKLTQKATKEALRRTIEDTAPPTCEESIIRIAQKARAIGIHLILATQRPSADVVTGLIKANIPTKIAFSVTTAMNSKIILDQTGAEALTGYGDMLFQDPRSKNIERLQGLYC